MGKDQELLEASRNGNIPVVEKILNQRAKRSGPLASLRRGPGANVQDSSGYSALHHAALNGHKEIVQLLLTHEASKNIVDVKGSSPLHLAAWTGNVDIVRLLLCHGPSVPNVNLMTKDNETALHCAAHFGHTDVVSDLLAHKCDASIRNTRQETALDLAAQYGRLETVELLVRAHPELIRPYAKGGSPPLLFPHTPLHLASRNGHKSVVAVLLSAGLDVNVRTSGGTALHEAALCGKVDVVRTLLDEGVDLAIRDSHHNTVMDLLGQFPAHVTHDITAIIKRHRGIPGPDGELEPLPPIPVPDPTLGSPYENVRTSQRGSNRLPAGVDSSSPGTSPTHWDFYHHHTKTRGHAEDRRISGTSAMSITSDNSLYQTPPYLRSMLTDGSFRSEELPMYNCRDLDQMSVSSTCSSTAGGGRRGLEPSPGSTSSTGAPSPRDRRFTDTSPGVYMTMGPGSYGHQSHRSHSPVSNSKVSPTPPKKPPRRNLSVSPTHPTHLMTMSADSSHSGGSGGGGGGGGGGNAYEYLFLARSGVRSHSDLEELQGIGTQTLGGRRDVGGNLRRGRSTDQYVDMRGRHGVMTVVEPGESFQQWRARHGDEDDDDTNHTAQRRHVLDQPIAITATYGNLAVRTTNPRRKLRRNNVDRSYDNNTYEPTHRLEVSEELLSSVAIEPIFVSNAYITLKSSQESLLDGREDRAWDKRLRKVQMVQPTSPTHYKQPPTPEHPPPSAMQAERKIHECIRPLSQEYKRRSRDIETETDEDLLLFPSLEDASSGSLSSSVSLSDKSAPSTDNHVEEFVGDAPFAGLLKGSVPPSSDDPRSSPRAERPKTLRRLKNVYENAVGSCPAGGGGGESKDADSDVIKRTPAPAAAVALRVNTTTTTGCEKGPPLSILSPFDEQEEWAKISEIMASFGTGLVRESVFVTELEQEFQSRLGLSRSESCSSPPAASPVTTVAQWLTSLNLADYESLFNNNGFDDIDFICGVLDAQDLKEMGIDSEKDCDLLLDSARTLPCKIQTVSNNHANNNNDSVEVTVDEWLAAIHLDCYSETFGKHLYTDMARVSRIWEVELTAVLEIHKAGHRKRILASVCGHQPGQGPNLEDINADLNQLKTNIEQLKEEIKDKLPAPPTISATGTLRHSKKSRPAPPPPSNGGADLEIRGPAELLVGVPSTLTTQWRHQPNVLVTGTVTYVANYLGSTVVRELRGTESTKKSIQKLKKSNKEPKTTPDITLAISYRGVKFLNTLTQETVCEHEIRNIHCACQDADDLTHFAYITKDHASKSHFCHVFCVQTMDQATEVILTLGQAFEVAYQLAIRDQRSHSRSPSASQVITHLSPSASASPAPSPSNHSRSRSVPEVKFNGQLGGDAEVETGTPVRVLTPLAPIAVTEEL